MGDHIFLSIYCLELLAKLKRWGLQFFTNQDLLLWNLMDLVIVTGGVLDLWLVPLLGLIQSELGVEIFQSAAGGGTFGTVLRLMRLVRVIRLVRLVGYVKPLRRLVVGVTDGVASMFWVLILAFVVLYGLGIVFTTIIRQGAIFGGEAAPKDALEEFGSVPASMFALFKLMNDDQSVADPFTDVAGGRLLFIIAMVTSNWALLAILTSVVSDNMISSSARSLQEELQIEELEEQQRNRTKLKILFGEIDHDKSGLIDEDEWQVMMDDPRTSSEITGLTGLESDDLFDLFDCLSDANHNKKAGRWQESEKRVLDYEELIAALKDERKVADKRSMLHLMAHVRSMDTFIRSMDKRTDERFHVLLQLSGAPSDQIAQLQKRESVSSPEGRALNSGGR